MIRNLFLCIALAGTLLLPSCGGRPQAPSNVDQTLKTETQALDSLPNCTVNVYVENSASMDGYVKGVTEFEQAVYSYISDIKLEDFCEALNLNYINSEILKQPDDVRDFIEKLEPSSFKMKGGNRGTTDISNLFKSIMEEQGENDIAVLISDFVFSPGKRDASQYLINQQIGIKSQFATKLKEYPDYAVVLYRLTSKFDGKYYNKFDAPTQIKGERPFYIWLLGNREQLKRLTTSVCEKNVKGNGVSDAYSISSMSKQVAYGILPMPRIGQFKLDHSNPKTNILSPKVDNKNLDTKFLVSIGVDYSSFLLDDSYLTDPQNYEVNNKAYRVEIVKNSSSTSTYTHIIKLMLDSSQPVISHGSIKISLLKNTALWANDLTDEEGVDINAEGAMEKTFGLKYLIGGVYDAYKADGNYATFTINIK